MLESIHSLVSIPGHYNKLQEQTLSCSSKALLYLLIDSFKITNQDEHSAGTTLNLAEADEGTYLGNHNLLSLD